MHKYICGHNFIDNPNNPQIGDLWINQDDRFFIYDGEIFVEIYMPYKESVYYNLCEINGIYDHIEEYD